MDRLTLLAGVLGAIVVVAVTVGFVLAVVYGWPQ